MTFRRPFAALILAALLAACNDGDSPQEGNVSGEVLEGTISDEMLPLEQVRSRAPLADPTAAATGAGAGGAAQEPATPQASEAPAEDEPAQAAED